jgi:hypothetical protein
VWCGLSFKQQEKRDGKQKGGHRLDPIPCIKAVLAIIFVSVGLGHDSVNKNYFRHSFLTVILTMLVPD